MLGGTYVIQGGEKEMKGVRVEGIEKSLFC